MSHPPRPPDEAERLAALSRYNILDTLPEQAFDDLALLAAHVCRAPIAFIGFIDAHRQWLKSRVGLTIQEIPRYLSFSAHTILEPDVCVVPDALADQRFATNLLVTSEPHIRFYASAQLLTPKGHVIGTLCVMDHVSRELSDEQAEALRVLARQVMGQLELRRSVAASEQTIAGNERIHEEIRFQAGLLDAVEEAIIASDLRGKIIYWNRFAERMYGWSRAEVAGRNVVDVVSAEISQGEAAEILSRLSRGESWSGEFIVRRRDGSSFPVQVTDSPIYDSGGELIGIVGISTDITPRKQAEEALQRSHDELERRVAQRTHELATANALLKEEVAEYGRAEQALRESRNLMQAVIEGTTVHIYVKDLAGRYLMVNSAAANFIGKPAGEIIGKYDTELFPPETARQIIEHDRQVLAAGEALTKEESGIVEGKLRTVLSVKTVYRNERGEAIGLVGISRDITERKRAEESLRLFASAIEQANEVITITTPELDLPGPRILFVNPAFTRMTGYAAEEVIGLTPRILQGPRTDRSVLTELRGTLARGEAFEGMAINYRKDGSEFYMEWRVDPIRDERGEVTHFVAVQRDVTERVRAKEARMQLQLQLIAAQEEERRRLSRELHDQIGQYLPALMLGLKALNETGPAQPRYAAQVEQLRETAMRIAHDVQNLARELRPAALDEFGLVNTLESYVEEWSQRHGIAVDFHRTGFYSDERLPPQVETTLYRIGQEALTNILKHAGAQNVSLILERGRSGVKMIVEDDGQGFDVETLMKAPLAERRLGLLGMRERVVLINGSLKIESTPGAGTTIVVNLPVSNEEGGDAP